jgi:hypothetical protein
VILLVLALTSGCAAKAEAPSSATSTSTPIRTDLEIAEVNHSDLSVASDPVLRTLADPGSSRWRRSATSGFEDDARDYLEHPDGPNLIITGPATTWTHPSGDVAIQYVGSRDGIDYLVTVLFTPPSI